MVKKDIIKEAIIESVKAQSKIAIVSGKKDKDPDRFRDPEYVVSKLLEQVDLLNSGIDRDTRFISGINVDDIEIVEELAYLITPLVISNNPQDRFYADLQFEEEIEGTFDYSLYMDLQHAFRRFFKKNVQSGMISIMSKKSLISFDEVKDKICLVTDSEEGESYCWNRPNSRSEAFWPYFVEADMVQYQIDTQLYMSEFSDNDIKVWVRENPFDGLGGNNSSYTTVTK